jgi:hypothetical protein
MTTASWNSAMVTAFSTGPTEPITKDNGTSIRLRDKELSGTQKEMFIMENLETTWPMDTVNILT